MFHVKLTVNSDYFCEYRFVLVMMTMRSLCSRNGIFQYYLDELCVRNGLVKTLVRHTAIARNRYKSADLINIDSATVLYKMWR
jgi:hypothetical protein